jgi:hypothetical protein
LLPFLPACATRRHRAVVEVQPPRAIEDQTHVVALPMSALRRRLAGFRDLAFRVQDPGGAELPTQIADLDLDGEVDSLLVQLRLQPGQPSRFTVHSPAGRTRMVPAVRVRTEGLPALFRRLDDARAEDARLPIGVLASRVRARSSAGMTPLFLPGDPLTVLADGPLWAAVELANDQGANLRLGVLAGSPLIHHRLLLPDRRNRELVVVLPGGAAADQLVIQEGRRLHQGHAVWSPPTAEAVFFRDRDGRVLDAEVGGPAIVLATERRELRWFSMPTWDGTQSTPTDAQAYARLLERVTTVLDLPIEVRWR